jgi:hypothetical protein
MYCGSEAGTGFADWTYVWGECEDGVEGEEAVGVEVE